MKRSTEKTAADESSRPFYLEKMYQTLESPAGLTRAEWMQLEPTLRVKHVSAKHRLQAAGELPYRYHFVSSGLVRLYYTTPEGKESNKAFYGEGTIVGSLSALILSEPCRFAIETIEPCTVIELLLKELERIIEPGNGWDRLMNHSYQMMLVRNERREAELLTMTAKQRFRQFVRNFPDYLARIPQYHIASYLGITPVALSRYKNEWLEEDN